MFRGNKSSTPIFEGTDTLIGQSTSIEGFMRCESNLRIEGKVTGDIECNNNVTIGETGIARSNISATNLIIAGKVYGDLTIQGTITIMPTGELHGNLTSSSLIIHEGATFNGSSNMKNESSTN
jgi:cytoskeletal protein CcmA (bactofilin family)